MSYLPDHQRHNDLYRALQICRLIAREPLSLYELADRLDCSDRTIRRAIYMLQDAGVDVMSASSVGDDGDDIGSPFGRLEMHAKVYKLDPRAWAGMLYLPADGGAR
jgi:hypothetical protein